MNQLCWRCGAPLAGGATTCHRCGALVVDDVEATTIAPPPVPVAPPPAYGPPAQPPAYGPPGPPSPHGPPGGAPASYPSAPPAGAPAAYPSAPPVPPPDAPTMVRQTPVPPREPMSNRSRTALALGAALVLVLVLGVVAVLQRDRIVAALGLDRLNGPALSRSTGPELIQPTPVATSSPARATTAPVPTPEPLPTAPSPTPTGVEVTVARTCGSSGRGDCYLTERTQPDGDSPQVKRWPEGSRLTVTCQVQGSSVQSSVLNRSSTVWARTSTGGYVAAIFVDGIDGFSVTTPC